MIFFKNFFIDDKARVPFSVIGIFLIIGSTFTTVYVSELENEKSKEILSSLEFSEVENILRFAEADIVRGLNYAGLYALMYMGRHPVIYSELENEVALDYADCDGDGLTDICGDNNIIDTSDEAIIFNMNWARNITRVKLNEYLKTNFMNDIFHQQGYSVNIKPSLEEEAISNWRNIKFKPIDMQLNRDFDIGFVTEGGHSIDGKSIYDVYWEVYIDLELVLCDISSGEFLDYVIQPCCVITSRLPLLMNLTYVYEDSINGVEGDIFGNKLQILTTIISEIYTEARALVQWASGPSKIKNIVDNVWLKFVTNAAIAVEQFNVFNSVDPMVLLSLILNAKDLAGGDSKPSDVINDWQEGIFSINVDEEILKILENEGVDPEDANDMINNPQNYTDNNEMMQVSIGNLSEDLVYDVIYVYYYHDSNDNSYQIQSNEFPGYKINVDGIDYYLGRPVDNKIFDRFPNYQKINQNIINETEEKIQDFYWANFTTEVTRNINNIGYENSWTAGPYDNLINQGEWILDLILNNDEALKIGDIIFSWPYSESWIVRWTRIDEWEICDEYNSSCNCCDETHIETHKFIQSQEIVFCINSIYPIDVLDIFHKKTIFGSSPHPSLQIDDNLQEVLSSFVSKFVEEIRDTVLFNHSIIGVVDFSNYSYGDELEYFIDWLKGENGCILEALNDIIELIKLDEESYGEISNDFKNYSILDDMDKGGKVLLSAFQINKDKYINEDFYKKNNSYISCGAKTISSIRSWFINKIEDILSQSAKEKAINEINSVLDDTSKLDSYEEIQSEYGNILSDLGSIQFGLPIDLIRNPTNLKKGWTENISFAVNQKPNYLTFHKPTDEEPWEFNIRNTCLFGPTGLPLLPTPITPWIITINLWEINVEGCFESFKIIDTLDETISNPLLGHVGQTYVRIQDDVHDYPCMSGKKIGETKPLAFSFWTLNFAIVPPCRLPIGDQIGGLVEYSDNE